MTEQELTRIARIWGCSVTLEITPKGAVNAEITWDKAARSYRFYGSMDSAVQGILSSLQLRMYRMINGIENQK